MRTIGALSLSLLIGTTLLGACTTEVTENNSGAGGTTSTGAGAGAGPTGQGGSATGTGGAAGSTTTGGTGGTAGTAGTGGTTGGSAGAATAGTGGTPAAGAGGTTGGAGGTPAAGAGGSTGGTGGATTGGTGGTTGGSGGSAGTGGGIGVGGSSSNDCQVRFAMMGCDIPSSTAVDVCFRAQGATSWTDPVQATGPLFKIGGDPTGFFYPGMSVYFGFPAGAWEIRLVEGGAADCGTPFQGAADGLVTVTQGANYTVVLEGTAAGTMGMGTAKPLQWHTFKDDQTPTNGGVNFQTVNALADYTGMQSISFCTQTKSTGGVSTVISAVPPLSDTVEVGTATASVGGETYADMFLLDTMSLTIAESNYEPLTADTRWYAIISGKDPLAADFAPTLTTCIHDPQNRGDDANGHPLAALSDLAQGCSYWAQKAPMN